MYLKWNLDNLNEKEFDGIQMWRDQEENELTESISEVFS